MPANQSLPETAFVHRSADKAKQGIVPNVLEQIHSDLPGSLPQHPRLLEHVLLLTFHFSLPKEKSFCFWLLKILSLQESELKMCQMAKNS